MELTQIKSALEDGLLSFPVTDFDEKGVFNAATYTERIEWFVAHNVSAVFVAGGTGEFFSLLEVLAANKTATDIRIYGSVARR